MNLKRELEYLVKDFSDFLERDDVDIKKSSFPLPYLPDKDGNSNLIGEAANKRVNNICRIILDSGSLERVADRQAVINLIKKTLGKYLFSENQKDLVLVKSDVESMIFDNLKSYSFIFPCFLTVASEEPDEVDFGNARIFNRPRFEEIMLSQAECGIRQRAEIDEGLFNDSLTNYRRFDWFVGVTVEGVFDSKIAKMRADVISKYALSCLNMILSASYSDRTDVGIHLIPENRKYMLSSVNGDNYSYYVETSVRGNVGLPSPLQSLFKGKFESAALKIFKDCIQDISKNSVTTGLSQRFLDAVSWYGEAVREKSEHVRVVKYITCLERLLLFDGGGIKNKISNRATALVARIMEMEPEEIEELWNFFIGAYNLRSDVLHGCISPLEVHHKINYLYLDRQIQTVLMSFCEGVLEEIQKASEKDLEGWLIKMVNYFGIDKFSKSEINEQ